MSEIFLISQFGLAIMLTIAVLLQKSSSIGLGAYSGSNESVFGAKGPANFLTKFTFALAFAFVVNTITLVYSYNTNYNKSIIDNVDLNSIVPSAPAVDINPVKVDTTTAPEAPTTSK